MKKFERIVLHIGLHKTGTTSLQDFLFEYRGPLQQELNVLYPSLRRNHSAPLFSAFTEHPQRYAENLKRGVDTREKAERANAENLALLVQEFEASSASQLILSGEDLSLLTEAGLRRLRDWLLPRGEEICVVCALRNPAKWTVSAAQSGIRGGLTYRQVDSKPPLQFLQQRLQRCAQVFDATSIKLIDFDAALGAEGGLPGAFFDVLELPRSWLQGKTVERRNEAMSLEAAYLISALNEDSPLYVDGKLSAQRFAGDIRQMIRETAGRPFSLSPAAMGQVADSSELELPWLEQTFAMRLDNTPLADPVEDAGEVLNFSPAAISSIAAQLHDKEQVRKNNSQLTNRVHSLQEQVQKGRAKLEASSLEAEKLRAELETRGLEVDIARAELETRGLEVDSARAELETLQARLVAMENSLSWKLTGPLRWLKSLLAGFG
jgi:hypothetical protein